MQYNPALIPGAVHPATTLLRPQSGIDKIMIYLNPYYVDYKRANSAVNLHPSKSYNIFPGNNMLCIREIYNHFYLIINQEFFSTIDNYLHQIYMALKILQMDGFFTIKQPLPWNHYMYFIGHITEIEFYFDNRVADLQVYEERIYKDVPEAKSENSLYNYKNTYYSTDYVRGKHPSSVKVYSKYNQMKKKYTRTSDGAILRPDIVNAEKTHPFKMRLEFTITWNTYSNYMVFGNLNGNYEQILNKWLELLAVKHNQYVSNNIFYNYGSNIMYDEVVREADYANGSRFTNRDGRLKCAMVNKDTMGGNDVYDENYGNGGNSTLETA